MADDVETVAADQGVSMACKAYAFCAREDADGSRSFGIFKDGADGSRVEAIVAGSITSTAEAWSEELQTIFALANAALGCDVELEDASDFARRWTKHLERCGPEHAIHAVRARDAQLLPRLARVRQLLGAREDEPVEQAAARVASEASLLRAATWKAARAVGASLTTTLPMSAVRKAFRILRDVVGDDVWKDPDGAAPAASSAKPTDEMPVTCDAIESLARARMQAGEAEDAGRRGDVARTLERARAARAEIDRVVAWLESPRRPPDLSKEIRSEHVRLAVGGWMGVDFNDLDRTVDFWKPGERLTMPQKDGLAVLRSIAEPVAGPMSFSSMWKALEEKANTSAMSERRITETLK